MSQYLHRGTNETYRGTDVTLPIALVLQLQTDNAIYFTQTID